MQSFGLSTLVELNSGWTDSEDKCQGLAYGITCTKNPDRLVGCGKGKSTASTAIQHGFAVSQISKARETYILGGGTCPLLAQESNLIIDTSAIPNCAAVDSVFITRVKTSGRFILSNDESIKHVERSISYVPDCLGLSSDVHHNDKLSEHATKSLIKRFRNFIGTSTEC